MKSERRDFVKEIKKVLLLNIIRWIFVLGKENLIMKVKVIKKKKEEVEQEEKVEDDSTQNYIG
jgi:hypothetical protein